jgi:hypothetical protein
LRVADGRTSEAKLINEVRSALVAHVGGKPTATQSMLIDRAAMLTFQVQMMDRAALKAGEMSEHACRSYLAWNNTLTRTLTALGLEAAPDGGDPLTEIHAQFGRKVGA